MSAPESSCGFGRLVARLEVELSPRLLEILGEPPTGQSPEDWVEELQQGPAAAVQRLHGALFDALPPEERGVLLLVLGAWLDKDAPGAAALRPWAEIRKRPARTMGIFKLAGYVFEQPLSDAEVRYLKRLAERGLVRVDESDDWRRFNDLTCQLPDELLPLLEARFPGLPLEAGDLGAYPPEVDADGLPPVAVRLDQAARDPRLVAAWPPAVFEAGGLLLTDWPRGPRVRSLGHLGALRIVLEGHRLGSLRLTRHGGGRSSLVVMLYDEVYRHNVQVGRRQDPPGRPLPDPGLSFLRGLNALLRLATTRSLRLTRAGLIYRRELGRLADFGPTWELPYLREGTQPEDLLVAAARALELVTEEAGRLRPAPAARGWLERPVDERHRRLFSASLLLAGLAGADGASWPAAPLLKAGLGASGWYPASHLTHLASLERRMAPQQLPWNRFRFRTFQLARWLKEHLYPLGLMSVWIDEAGELTAFRPTARLRQLLGAEPAAEAPVEPTSRLVVNPDFETLLFPGAGAEELSLLLFRIARLEKNEAVRHFKLNPDSVRQAALEGLDGREMASRLAAAASHPLPDNVRLTLTEWAAGVKRVRYERLNVVRVDRPETMVHLYQFKEFKSRVVEELTPTTVVVREFPLGGGLRERLKREGIFLQA